MTLLVDEDEPAQLSSKEASDKTAQNSQTYQGLHCLYRPSMNVYANKIETQI